jgi:hypothetical protein
MSRRFVPDALQRPGEAVAGLALLPDDALQEHMAAGLPDQLDMRVERHSGAAAGKEMSGHVEGHIMALRHSSAAPPGEQAHVDEAHHRPAVERAAHILVLLGGEHPADAAPRPVRPNNSRPVAAAKEPFGKSPQLYQPGLSGSSLAPVGRARRLRDPRSRVKARWLSSFTLADRQASAQRSVSWSRRSPWRATGPSDRRWRSS